MYFKHGSEYNSISQKRNFLSFLFKILLFVVVVKLAHIQVLIIKKNA